MDWSNLARSDSEEVDDEKQWLGRDLEQRTASHVSLFVLVLGVEYHVVDEEDDKENGELSVADHQIHFKELALDSQDSFFAGLKRDGLV